MNKEAHTGEDDLNPPSSINVLDLVSKKSFNEYLKPDDMVFIPSHKLLQASFDREVDLVYDNRYIYAYCICLLYAYVYMLCVYAMRHCILLCI